MEGQKLNLLQLELLKIYSFNPKEEDLIAIKKMIAQYFSNKLEQNIQNAIQQNKISEADLESWINE